MARVPQNSKGAARRAYHQSYSRSGANIAYKASGGNKVKTTKSELGLGSKGGGGGSSRSSSSDAPAKSPKGATRISFGQTGHVEDYDV